MNNTTTRSKSFLQRLHPKHLDMIGSELKFKYGDQERFKTGFGGCLTLIIIIATLAALLSTIQNLIISPQPEVSISTKFSEKSPKINLYDEEINLGFAVGDPLKGTLPSSQSSRYITIKAYIESFAADLETGAPIFSRPVEIHYKPCPEIQDKKFIKPFLNNEVSKQLAYNFGLCPELSGISEKFFIQAKVQDPPMFTLSIYLYPCSLPNRDDCASLQEVPRARVHYTTNKKAFDPNNYTNPVTMTPEFNGILKLDPRSTKIMSNVVKLNEIWDDRVDFLDANLRLRYADYHLNSKDQAMRDPQQVYCSMEMIEKHNFDCLPYIHFSFQSSGETTVIRRTYSKFFSSLGEVGGTAETLMLLSLLIYSWYNSYFVDKFLKKELFGKEEGGREAIMAIFEEGGEDEQSLSGNHLDLENVGRGSGDQLLERRFDQNHRNRLTGLHKGPLEEKRRKRKQEEQVKATIQKSIQRNQDGVELYKKLNRLEILEKILLEEHDKVLMPLVLLNLQKSTTDVNREPENKNKNKLHLNRKIVKVKQNKVSFKSDKSLRSRNPPMSIQEAYTSLKESNPDPGIKLLIRDFILENLPAGIRNKNPSPQEKLNQPRDAQKIAENIDQFNSGPKEPDDPHPTDPLKMNLNRDQRANEINSIKNMTKLDQNQFDEETLNSPNRRIPTSLSGGKKMRKKIGFKRSEFYRRGQKRGRIFGRLRSRGSSQSRVNDQKRAGGDKKTEKSTEKVNREIINLSQIEEEKQQI